MLQHRITDPAALDADLIAAEIHAGKQVVVQYSQPVYQPQQLALLNDLAKTHDQNLEVRFYGHDSTVFDASVVLSVPDAKNLSIDCLRSASNLNALSHCRDLKKLSLGVFELEDSNILSKLDLATLNSISLSETRRSNIDLSALAACKQLTRLHTTGHTKRIETILSLPELCDLSLSQIKRKDDLGFVSDMPQLLSLRIVLGGRASLANVTPPNLKSLAIILVQGLEDVWHLGRFEQLETLWIEDQIRLKKLDVGPNPKLREIKILNCKTLERIGGLAALNSLSHVRISRTAITYEDFIQGDLPSSLSILAFYTGKKKRNAEIKADLSARGFREFS